MTQQIAKNTLYLTLASIGQKGLAFVYYLFLAKILLPEKTGAYFLALSVILIFGVIADFGITSVLIREIAKTPEKAKQFISQALGLKFPFVIFAFFLVVVVVFFLPYEPYIRQLIFLALFILCADTFSLFFYGVLRGFQKLSYESYGIFFGQLITVIVGGFLLWLFPSLSLLVTALFFGSFFNMFFSASRVVSRLGWSVLKPVWNKEEIKRLFLAAIPFALACIFVKIYSYIDSLFLSFYLGISAVGIYSVAYKFTYAFQFLPLAFVAALYPGMSDLFKRDKEKLLHVFEQALWYMMIISVPIIFGLWAIAPFVIALTGEAYQQAVPLLQVLIFVLLPIFLDFPVGSLLNAANRQSTKTAVMGVTMVLNVICNVILIPFFGIFGSVFAALISFSFLFCGGLYFVPSILPNFSVKKFLKKLFFIIISGGAMGIMASWLCDFLVFYFVIPLSALFYILLLFLTKSCTKQQFLLLTSFFKKGESV